MKFRLPLLILVIALAVSAAAGQSREFDLKISGENSASAVSRSGPMVTVVITNRSPDVLDTGSLPFLNFHISLCLSGEKCDDGSYFLFEAFESRKLAENATFSIFRDLSAAGRWKRGSYNTQAPDYVAFSDLPEEAVHLWADVKIPDGFTVDADTGKRVPKYREYRSNVLTLVP